MKIRVSYAELQTGPGYNNKRAEAEIEIEVKHTGNLDAAFENSWERVKAEVKRQLDEPERETPQVDLEDDDIPF